MLPVFQLPLWIVLVAGGGGATCLGDGSYTAHSVVVFMPQNEFLWIGALISKSENGETKRVFLYHGLVYFLSSLDCEWIFTFTHWSLLHVRTQGIKRQRILPNSFPVLSLSLWRLVMLSLNLFRFSCFGNTAHTHTHNTSDLFFQRRLQHEYFQTQPQSTYLLIAYGLCPPFVVKWPGFELLHGLIHSDFPHFHPLLERDELPLSWGLHPRVGVIGRSRGKRERSNCIGTEGFRLDNTKTETNNCLQVSCVCVGSQSFSSLYANQLSIKATVLFWFHIFILKAASVLTDRWKFLIFFIWKKSL